MRFDLKQGTLAEQQMAKLRELTGLSQNEVLRIMVEQFAGEFENWWSRNQSHSTTAFTAAPMQPAHATFATDTSDLPDLGALDF